MGKMFPYNDIFKSKCRINAIIIATGHGGVSGDQIYPFYLYKNELKKRFNLRLKKKILFTSVDDMLAQIRKNKCDILFIQTPLRIDKKEEINFFKEICSYKDKSRIVYLDSEDGSNMSHFEILPFVDLYVCKQHFGMHPC